MADSVTLFRAGSQEAGCGKAGIMRNSRERLVGLSCDPFYANWTVRFGFGQHSHGYRGLTANLLHTSDPSLRAGFLFERW